MALFAAALGLAACTSGNAKPPVSPSSQATVPTSPAQITGPTPSGSYSPPQQKLFAPYDENGHLVGQASKTATGSCFSSSITIPIAGVFRCLAGNTIYDPCFAPAVDTNPLTVACFDDPWTPGTLMTLTTPLPTENLILKNGDPWALELPDATHCVVLTGTLPELDDNVLDYHCTGGTHSNGGVAAGGANTVASLQTSADGVISVLVGPSNGPLVSSGVTIAWRGQSYRFGSAE
ncbi:MAG TPA: hypothetical protein VGL26_02585 [Jatrophihabitans sp.]|jgi:hypothetical protein